jgi:hypothetical protein
MGRFIAKDEQTQKSQSHSGLDMSGLKDEDWTLQLTPEEVSAYFKDKDGIMLDSVTRRQIYSVHRRIVYTLHLAKSVLSLGLKVSEFVQFHPSLIQSGFVWRALHFNLFALQKDLIQAFSQANFSLKEIIVDAALILVNLCSFADNMAEIQTDMIDDDKKQTIERFFVCIKRLLPHKILKLLIVPDSVYKANQAEKFIKLLAIGEEKTPDFIWNDSMRAELEKALADQFSKGPTSLETFDY